MTDKRKPGQSQLDYLWTTFGGMDIANQPNSIPSEEVVLTESAIVNLINKKFSGTDITLDSIVIDNQVTLQIKDSAGSIISSTTIDKGAIITQFDTFMSTQEDVDNGIVDSANTLYLRLKDSIEQIYYVKLFDVKGSETDTAVTTVRNNRIATDIKIDNPITEKSVELRGTPNGIQAYLAIDESTNSSVKVTKSRNGISCKYAWEDEEVDIKFKSITFEAYNIITPDNGTVYFCKNHPCIFFRGNKYGASGATVDYFTKGEVLEEIQKAKDEVLEEVDSLKNNINTQLSWWEE